MALLLTMAYVYALVALLFFIILLINDGYAVNDLGGFAAYIVATLLWPITITIIIIKHIIDKHKKHLQHGRTNRNKKTSDAAVFNKAVSR